MSTRKPSLQALEALFADKAPDALAVLVAEQSTLIDFLTPAIPYAPRLGLSELRLEALNRLLDGAHGVERIELRRERGQRATIRYINTGDTYSATLARVWTAHDGGVTYRVTTWGDEVERLERLGYRAD